MGPQTGLHIAKLWNSSVRAGGKNSVPEAEAPRGASCSGGPQDRPKTGPRGCPESSKRRPESSKAPKRAPGGPEDELQMLQRSPREPQEGSSVLQERVREASEAPKRPVRGARSPKRAPKYSKRASERPRTLPRGLCEAPEGFHGPKHAPRSPKEAPRGPQSGQEWPRGSFRCRGRRSICFHCCFALHWLVTLSALALSAPTALALHLLSICFALAFSRSASAVHSRWTRAALVLHLPSTRCETSLGHSHLLPIVCTRAAAALQSLYRSAFAMHGICIHFALAPYSLCALSAFVLHSLGNRIFALQLLCIRSARTRHSLCTCASFAMNSLYSHSIFPLHSLCTRAAFALYSFRTRSSLTLHSLRTRSSLTLHSLSFAEHSRIGSALHSLCT